MTPRLKFIGQPDIEANFAIAQREERALFEERGICDEWIETARRWRRLGFALIKGNPSHLAED